MAHFVGTRRQVNGLWMSYFYSHNDKLHLVTKDEEYAEFAYLELLFAIEEFDENNPDIETYYTRRMPVIEKKRKKKK